MITSADLWQYVEVNRDAVPSDFQHSLDWNVDDVTDLGWSDVLEWGTAVSEAGLQEVIARCHSIVASM